MESLPKYDWKLFQAAMANSYSMVFFSVDRWFAILLFLLTFLDPVVGIAGLFSVLIVNGLAILLSMNANMIRSGEFGFNALLVGLGLGAYYELNPPLLILLFFAALITFFITILSLGFLSKYGLPFISIPFVLALWTVMLASRNFEALGVSQRGLYLLNELYGVGDHYLVNSYNFINELAIPTALKTYFRSLGAILFQFNIISGAILAVALLIYSRIGFTLSLIGFFTAYLFFQMIGADMNQLNYNYVGFNFILSAIAIGGFYLVPSKWSFFWAILLIPILSILTTSLANLLIPFQLGAYSLPFNLVVISFIYVMKWREKATHPEEVPIQTFSPEKNKYRYLSDLERFRNYRLTPISLPVMGEWYVDQGHNGAITHREEWRHAWDFVITDQKGRQYKNDGRQREDYYCYRKPLIAAADGKVVEIKNQVADNPIGETNLQQNWGNSILIEHAPSLYSQISHILPGSFKVSKGDQVKKGQVLALCGNSGRSPTPHVHFQVQSSPYIGSRTLAYPISSYLAKMPKNKVVFRFYDFPEEGNTVQNLSPSEPLKYAYYFIPGKKIAFLVNGREKASWECQTNAYNQSYIICRETGAVAYFQNNGTLHYFTSFIGKKDSLLYHFFLANFKVALAYQDGLELTDSMPLDLLVPPAKRWIQDLLAPFYQYSKGTYHLKYQQIGVGLTADRLLLNAQVKVRTLRKAKKTYRYKIHIEDNQITKFEIDDGKEILLAESVKQSAHEY